MSGRLDLSELPAPDELTCRRLLALLGKAREASVDVDIKEAS